MSYSNKSIQIENLISINRLILLLSGEPLQIQSKVSKGNDDKRKFEDTKSLKDQINPVDEEDLFIQNNLESNNWIQLIHGFSTHSNDVKSIDLKFKKTRLNETSKISWEQQERFLTGSILQALIRPNGNTTINTLVRLPIRISNELLEGDGDTTDAISNCMMCETHEPTFCDAAGCPRPDPDTSEEAGCPRPDPETTEVQTPCFMCEP